MTIAVIQTLMRTISLMRILIINPEDLAYLDEDPVKQEYVKVTIVLKERLSRMSEFGTRELRIFFISSRSSLFRL